MDTKHSALITNEQLHEDEKKWIYGDPDDDPRNWMSAKLRRWAIGLMVSVPTLMSVISAMNSQFTRNLHKDRVPEGYEFIVEGKDKQFWYGEAEGIDENSRLVRAFSIKDNYQENTLEVLVDCSMQTLNGKTQRIKTVGMSFLDYACK